MLAVPRVKGFALSMKKWFEFTVSDITPVTWNEKLLGNLVIPDEEKQLLLALVAHTAKEEDGGFDDFIEGKGIENQPTFPFYAHLAMLGLVQLGTNHLGI